MVGKKNLCLLVVGNGVSRTLPNNQSITQMWNRMVENLLSVLEHFLAGCSSCFVKFLAALEALSFALDARRVKLPFALGVVYLTTKLVRKFHSF